MDYNQIFEHAFYVLASCLGTAGVAFIKNIAHTLAKLNEAISELNVKMEILTTKMLSADESLKDHENRLRRIEITEKP